MHILDFTLSSLVHKKAKENVKFRTTKFPVEQAKNHIVLDYLDSKRVAVITSAGNFESSYGDTFIEPLIIDVTTSAKNLEYTVQMHFDVVQRDLLYFLRLDADLEQAEALHKVLEYERDIKVRSAEAVCPSECGSCKCLHCCIRRVEHCNVRLASPCMLYHIHACRCSRTNPMR